MSEPEIKQEAGTGFFTKLADTMIVNLLFLFTSLPIVTIVDAAASMYYVTLKKLRGSEEGTVKLYFHFFRNNFRKSLPYDLLLVVCVVLLVSGYMAAGASGQTILIVLLTSAAIVLTILFSWIIPLFAQFEDPFSTMISNSLILAVEYPGISVTISFANSILILLFLFLPGLSVYALYIWSMIGAGLICRFISSRLIPIFNDLIGIKENEQAEEPIATDNK